MNKKALYYIPVLLVAAVIIYLVIGFIHQEKEKQAAYQIFENQYDLLSFGFHYYPEHGQIFADPLYDEGGKLIRTYREFSFQTLFSPYRFGCPTEKCLYATAAEIKKNGQKYLTWYTYADPNFDPYRAIHNDGYEVVNLLSYTVAVVNYSGDAPKPTVNGAVQLRWWCLTAEKFTNATCIK